MAGASGKSLSATKTGRTSSGYRRHFSLVRSRSRPRSMAASNGSLVTMCRNIKTLYNFEPPATEDEIRASSIQFVRKLSGFAKPSKANEEAFNRAVDQVTDAARELLDSLVTNAPPRDRETEASKARTRAMARFG